MECVRANIKRNHAEAAGVRRAQLEGVCPRRLDPEAGNRFPVSVQTPAEHGGRHPNLNSQVVIIGQPVVPGHGFGVAMLR
jgi:hypothetical protein